MRDLFNFGDKNKEVFLCYFYSIKVRVLIYVYLLRLEFFRFIFKIGKIVWILKGCDMFKK